jgi:hypothetical protein
VRASEEVNRLEGYVDALFGQEDRNPYRIALRPVAPNLHASLFRYRPA